MEQMMHLDKFVNIGAIHSIVEKVNNLPQKTTILTNEQVTLYLAEEEQTKMHQ